ncbi:hypothetical protein [Sphingomonas baiyangensis]|uniref:Uncharacterized protein n=1 Tax=Sphingomonas baiyangensis TaxID=2572576 RepID=A0A4U1L6W7_9SPHN|nr:hypothetical protein [Sphingomonas baiyangensis]TKD52050.1 hypothetical protein FBR43_15890 [Sphingomonas baiyangensis]
MAVPLPLAGRWRVLLARLIALAMVAMVLGHAVAPVAAPLERGRGSAFSAATADVSLLAPGATIQKSAVERAGGAILTMALLTLAIALVATARPPARFATPPARAPPDRALRNLVQPQAPPAR